MFERQTFYFPQRGMMDPHFYGGPPFPNPLSLFLRRSREVVDEEMEQPLDLSQREPELEEPVCQYTNCSCPRKHLLSLDNKESNSAPFRPRCETASSLDYSQFQKRPNEQTDNNSQFHPKRRKIDEYNKNISRSSSDTNLYGYGGPTETFRSYSPYTTDETSLAHRSSPEEKVHAYWKPSQTVTSKNTYPSAPLETPDNTGNDVRTVSSHTERLPKKRSHARNLSYENLYTKSHLNENKLSRTPSPDEMVVDSDMSRGSSVENIKPTTELVLPELNAGTKVKGDELRASIMKEVRENQDDEDVDEFRKRFFGSLFSRSKAASTNKGSSSPLDMLISDRCKSELNFRPKSSHIDQILRGEKQGKLCLMDIVELQVEIGLA